MKLSDLESIARDLRAQLAAVGKRVDDLNEQVDAAKREPDGFTAFLYAARKSYGRASATDGKGGKRMERAVWATYVQAQEFGLKVEALSLTGTDDPNTTAGTITPTMTITCSRGSGSRGRMSLFQVL